MSEVNSSDEAALEPDDKALLSRLVEELVQDWLGSSAGTSEERLDHLDGIAWALARKGSVGAAFLASQLDTEDPEVLSIVIRNLGDADLTNSEKHAHVRRFLHETDDPRVISASLELLTWNGGDRTVPREVEALMGHESGWVRRAVVQYLALLFESKSVPHVERALEDPDPWVRSAAISGIEDFESDARALSLIDRVWASVDDPDEIVRSSARSCLWERVFHNDMSASVDVVGKATDDRIRATRCLGFLSETGLPRFLRMFDDPAAVVRLAAADCLSWSFRIHQDPFDWLSELIPNLAGVLKRWQHDSDERVRESANSMINEANLTDRIKAAD